MRIGTTRPEAEAYLDGVRHRGVLVFATGPADKVDTATEIMNRRNAIESEEFSGPEPDLSVVNRGSAIHERAAFRASGADPAAGRRNCFRLVENTQAGAPAPP